MRSMQRNDPRQYDDLSAERWRPSGPFALLHWLAAARAALIPPAAAPGRILVDAGCGGGLLAPHLHGKGYRHIGVDLRRSGLRQAAPRGVTAVNGDVTALPLAARSADVVVAGEILEHVTDLPGTVAELCRVLRPGGLVVLDTVNDTALSRLITVTLGEGLGIAPAGLHDPALFVSPRRLIGEFARHGVVLTVRGIRPSLRGLYRWLVLKQAGRGRLIRPVFSDAVLYQGTGRHAGRPPEAARPDGLSSPVAEVGRHAG
ncbi:MAG TPA: methyltransferase domain-containing protein [Actinoplanes sp.]|nr:methyltransferase domain-containing protein [Actinoplanes sp.]